MSALTPYGEFVFKTRYARFREDLGRRENFDETINRYLDFFEKRYPAVVKPIRQELFDAVNNLEVVPSMRAFMTADESEEKNALSRDEVSGYNCAFTPIDSLRAFDELCYLLLNGTGVGFSCESQFIKHLPVIADEFVDTDITLKCADSKIGWAKHLRQTIQMLAAGQVPQHDYSAVRAAGSRLVVFGGRSSGPEPLAKMINAITTIFRGAAGRQLRSIECHDICCHIAAAIVVGGVRRSALIGLSDLGDHDLAMAKHGSWWNTEPQRALSNNSVAYDGRPGVGEWMQEWTNIYESKSGERGIYNRAAVRTMSPDRRDTENYSYSPNPCAEINLVSGRIRDGEHVPGTGGQLCNLSEVIVHPDDRLAELKTKVRIAAVFGSLQACLTNFRYLSASWKNNCERERLLGVSMTGILSNKWLVNCDPSVLEELREHAVRTNQIYAKKLGITPATAVTAIKPSGTVSALAGGISSGIHPIYSKYFWRRVRNDKKDPASDALIAAGIPHTTDPYNDSAWVFRFPMEAPKGAITADELSAIDHLELWKKWAVFYTEHKPSITVMVREHEWASVGAWMYENFDIASGLSFLPHSDDDHTYVEAPFERCTKEDLKSYPKISDIDWDSVSESFKQDTPLACTAGGCEI